MAIPRIGNAGVLIIIMLTILNILNEGRSAKATDTIPRPETETNLRQLLPIRANPSIQAPPTANPNYPTLSTLVIQGKTSKGVGTREFLVSLGLDSITGAGPSGNTNGKVTLYAGINGNPKSGDIWAVNTVTQELPGFGGNVAQGFENDCNNKNADRGNALGTQGLEGPTFYCFASVSGATHKITALYLGIGPANHGYLVAGSEIAQDGFADYSHSPVAFNAYGQHQFVLDTTHTAIERDGAAIRIGNSQSIVARNAANNSDIPVIRVDRKDVLQIGSNLNSGVRFMSPQIDGAGLYVVAKNNGTLVVPPGKDLIILDPTESLNNETIVVPPDPIDGQTLRVFCGQEIESLKIKALGREAVRPSRTQGTTATSTCSATNAPELVYSAEASAWFMSQ